MWRELLAEESQPFIAPWFGRPVIFLPDSSQRTVKTPPAAHGFYQWQRDGRKNATLLGEAEFFAEKPKTGYIVGSTVRTEVALTKSSVKRGATFSTPLFLGQNMIPFTRILLTVWGPDVVCLGPAIPLGDEDAAREAFDARSDLKMRPILADVRRDLERLRELREQAEREYQERIERELREATERERQRRLAEEQARLAATIDGRARIALGRTGSTFLSLTPDRAPGTHLVRYRVNGQQLACVVDDHLRIVDAGICLTAHDDTDEWEEGTKGDTWLTLASLPSVVMQAQRERKLVIYRHG